MHTHFLSPKISVRKRKNEFMREQKLLLAPHTPLGVNAIWWSIPIGWILADIAGGNLV